MKEDSNNSRMTSSVRAVIGAEVLVVDRDASVREGVSKIAAEAKMNASCVADPADAWELVRNRFFSVAVIDLDTPLPNAGLETITSLQMVSKTTSIIVLSPRKSYESALEAIRAGAVDVVHKSPDSVKYLRDKMVAAAGLSQRKREIGASILEASKTHDRFLQLLMAAEKEITDLQDQIAGRDPATIGGDMSIMVADRNGDLAEALTALSPPGYTFEHASSGGEALDRGSSKSFHFALVSHDLPDLPQSMVVRSLKSQRPELVALTFRGPCAGGSVEIADGGGGSSVVSNFTEPKQLVERLPDLAEAFRAKERQRRYTQAFREKHYDFVRKFVSLKEKLDLISE